MTLIILQLQLVKIIAGFVDLLFPQVKGLGNLCSLWRLPQGEWEAECGQ